MPETLATDLRSPPAIEAFPSPAVTTTMTTVLDSVTVHKESS
jgi:hypothetical protein